MESKYMDNRKDDKYYIKEVIDNIDIIINYVNNKSYEEFISPVLILNAIDRSMKSSEEEAITIQ